MKTALLTGSTAIQIGSERTHLGIITAVRAWRKALETLGYEVDHRGIKVGEDISGYDKVVVALNKSNSLSSSYVFGALWALASRDDATIVLDDWQNSGLVADYKCTSANPERFFRLHGAKIPLLFHDVLRNTGWKLGNRRWPWKVVAPIIGNGDITKLGIPADIVGIDPSNLVTLYPLPKPLYEIKKEKRWVQASLLQKEVPNFYDWPVVALGWQNSSRGHGGPGKYAQPRVPESELMELYSESWGILSPAHPHAGSGWWRVRYLMAARAGAILSASEPKEAEVLGDPYLKVAGNFGVELVESVGSSGALRKLAIDQQACLESICWPADRAVSAFEEVIS